MRFGRSGEWRNDVEKHCDTVPKILTVTMDKMCALHVHVSPAIGERWTLEQLKPLAKAIIYFDEALNGIYAPSRRKHKFTMSNKKHNHTLKDLDIEVCFESIDECASKRALIKLMQTTLFETQTRDFAWNFENTEKKDNSKEEPTGSVGASLDS